MNINMILSNLFNLFQIIPNLYEFVLILFENMHTAAQLHTTALPDSRTLPHTAAHCRTHFRTT
jgi:hypothetical protein